MNGMEGILQYESVCIRYGDREVVHRVSFAVQPGQVLAIVGESGCGKSTLLKGCRRADRPRLPGGGTDFSFRKKPLLDLPKRQRLALLGSGAGAWCFRRRGASLCPVRTVGAQVAESLAAAQGLSRREAKRRGAGAVCPAGPARAGRAVAGLSLSAVRRDAAAGGDCHGAAFEAQGSAGRRTHQRPWTRWPGSRCWPSCAAGRTQRWCW